MSGLKNYKNILFPLFLWVSSCAVYTHPTTLDERSLRAAEDKKSLFDNQEKVDKPITLYEAIARAVKYNSQQKVALMEQAVAYDIAETATLDLLPEIAADGGFSHRSRQLAISADAVDKNQQTLPDSYIEDKNIRNAQLQIVYNVLDFGISYVNARQLSDKRFISEEIRRKSIQQIVHDVRTIFWKAAAGQRIEHDLNLLIAAVQNELKQYDYPYNRNEQKTIEQLKNQRQLLTALNRLMGLRSDISDAKSELADLMNLPPLVDFSLDIPADMDHPEIIKNFGQVDLEYFALVNRPELRIADYEARIAAQQAKKELLRMFPGIEFGAGVNYNSNSFLKNKSWADAGIGITWNLMNLFSRPKAIKLAENQKELERWKRLSITMAVISQVNVSLLQLIQAAEVFEVCNSLDDVNQKLWEKEFESLPRPYQKKHDLILLAVERLSSQIKRDFAFAEYKGAQSYLFVALGVDPLPEFIANASVASLAKTLENNLSKNAPSGFKEVAYDQKSFAKAKSYVFEKKHLDVLSANQRYSLDNSSDNLNKKLNKKQIIPMINKTDKMPVSLIPVKKNKSSSTKAADDFFFLQISSFEKLNDAQNYWDKLVKSYPMLANYSPIFKEVNVNGKNRFRTFIAGVKRNLKQVCSSAAEELKSCLIFNKKQL